MKPRPRWENLGEFDVQLVCLNGHQITDSLISFPKSFLEYCGRCGEPTIYSCEFCGEYLRGANVIARTVELFYQGPVPSAFCTKCGKPFPWTQRKMDTAIKLAQEVETIGSEELQNLKESLPDLTKDTPQSGLAVIRLKKILTKAGNTIGPMILKVLAEVLTSEAKHKLGI